MVNIELEELLAGYDLSHSSIICDNKVEFNVNYKKDNEVEVLLKKNKINQGTYKFKNDFDFNSCVLPKIFQVFLTKNGDLSKRTIMGTDDCGTLVIDRIDGRESLIIRNCSKDVMNLFESLENAYSNLKESLSKNQMSVLGYENELYTKYIACNIALDYAKYISDFMDDEDFNPNARKSYLENLNVDNFDDINNLIILDIARYAYSIGFGSFEEVWSELSNHFDNEKIKEVVTTFSKISFDENSVFTDALICAEYELYNESFINNNVAAIKEAIESVECDATYSGSNFLQYWDGRRRYYDLLGNNELVKICSDFLSCNRLILDKEKEEMGVKKVRRESLVSKLKNVKNNSRPDFSTMINEPIVLEETHLFKDEEHEAMALGAEEQARKLIELMSERDQIKKDAEEFAKIILKSQKERREILKAAQEQARKIFELERENEELRKLAEDNARSIFNRERKFEQELKLREVVETAPVSKSDIDKIQYLLNALSAVKEIDFAVNHPTVMQEVVLLEEKIITYLSTHKNVVEDSSDASEGATVEIKETKTPNELLSIIRNVYTTSHTYEKEGRHTLINVMPDKEKYKVTLYSVKNDTDDVLTEVYFENEFFNNDVIEQLCDIFTREAVIVASKTDNIPNDLADYLVIDSQDNAIKFMGCNKEIIQMAKAYL